VVWVHTALWFGFSPSANPNPPYAVEEGEGQAQSPKLISWVLLTPAVPQTRRHGCKHNEALTMMPAIRGDTLAPSWHLQKDHRSLKHPFSIPRKGITPQACDARTPGHAPHAVPGGCCNRSNAPVLHLPVSPLGHSSGRSRQERNHSSSVYWGPNIYL